MAEDTPKPIEVLENRMKNVIQIHCDAGDVTILEVIGILEVIKLDIYQDYIEESVD